MIVMPAIDLRDGACVQLVGGRFEDERVRLDDPLAVARDFRSQGFRRLHVVDLDAAMGTGSNAAIVRAILTEPGIETQVGGGVRDHDAIAALLSAGAARAIAGTRAIEDPDWLAEAAARFPGRMIVAADVRRREVVTRGWRRETALDVLAFVDGIADLPLAGLLVTAVHREGQMAGPDLELIASVIARSTLPLHVAGGIATVADLQALARLGCHASVVGMALYTGALDLSTLTQEYAS